MTSSGLHLETDRLTLVPFTLEFIEALERHEAAERLVGARIPAGWPDEELRGLLALYADWVHNDASVVGYGPWIVVARAEKAVVGSAGFVGKPDDERTIEVGFGTHADYRNRGYASEAARDLLAWAFDQPAVERVVATCDPSNAPSVRVLEKIGMNHTGLVDGQ